MAGNKKEREGGEADYLALILTNHYNLAWNVVK